MVKINLADLKKLTTAVLNDHSDQATAEFHTQFNAFMVSHLLDDIEYALKLLRQGKAQFAPSTTNSDVDYFLEKYEVKP